MNSLSLSLLTPLSPLSSFLLDFHNVLIMGILIGILSIVLVVTVSIFAIKETNKIMNQKVSMEFLWIILPMGILLTIGLPSVKMLYQLDETFLKNNQIIKVTGFQWYWTYENIDWSSINNFLLEGEGLQSMTFESYNKSSSSSFDGLNNLSATLELNCDSVLPYRFIITAADVMHSWALPNMFVKVDAIPGRLNQIELFFPPILGSLYGQCSELCGVNHSFMPIVVKLES